MSGNALPIHHRQTKLKPKRIGRQINPEAFARTGAKHVTAERTNAISK